MRPNIISNARPKDEIVKIGLNLSPAIKPVAPINSSIITNKPIFSKPNLLNSFFICGEMK